MQLMNVYYAPQTINLFLSVSVDIGFNTNLTTKYNLVYSKICIYVIITYKKNRVSYKLQKGD